MSLVKMNFESQYLGNNHNISVILPDKPRGKSPAEFYQSGEKYKVLWLLHGGFGDHSDWLRKSMIELYACEKDLIVVMPSAWNSVYMNWPDFGTGFFMADYFFDELMPLIYNWFPASDKREDNFITGLSMGSMGSMKLFTMHPEKFAAAACLSAPFRDAKGLYENDRERYEKQILPRYGAIIKSKYKGDLEAFLASDDSTWEMMKRIDLSALPKVYVAIGLNDHNIADGSYWDFKDYIQKDLKLDWVFEEEEGYAHEWRFWDKYIQKALTFFGLDQMDAGNPF